MVVQEVVPERGVVEEWGLVFVVVEVPGEDVEVPPFPQSGLPLQKGQ